jgi:hypothetical protein
LEKNQTSQRILLSIKIISNNQTPAIVLAGAISVNFVSRAAATKDRAERPNAPEKDTSPLSSSQLFKDFHEVWQESL